MKPNVKFCHQRWKTCLELDRNPHHASVESNCYASSSFTYRVHKAGRTMDNNNNGISFSTSIATTSISMQYIYVCLIKKMFSNDLDESVVLSRKTGTIIPSQ